MAKQLVFIVMTDAEGRANHLAKCDRAGGLTGRVKSIEYITDNRVPFESTACFMFSTGIGNLDVLNVQNIGGREIWPIENGPMFDNEPIKVIVTDAGKGRAGSFVVTCS